MPSSAKGNKGKNQASKQTKLFDLNLRRETQDASNSMATQEGIKESENSKSDQILATLESLRNEFSSKLDNVTTTLQDVKREMKDYNDRMSRAEERIATAEDEVASLQAKVSVLQAKNKTMEDKLADLETRSRLNNVRLVNLPEGAEGHDVCTFLEKWIPEALGNGTPRLSVSVERAHRIGPRGDGASRPRALIMKFLNYRDKQAVIRAARDKKDVYFRDQRVRFYPDLAATVHQQRKKFDPIRDGLRKLGIRNGITYPATLLVTYENKTLSFKTPEEASELLKKIQEGYGQAGH